MDEDPKSERECMLSVVDPKGNGQNKFRYIVATLDEDLVCGPPQLSTPRNH
jgi:U3 small nucleolar RNA-associated protein 23